MLLRPILFAQLGSARVVVLEAGLTPDMTGRLTKLLLNFESHLEKALELLEDLVIHRRGQFDSSRTKKLTKLEKRTTWVLTKRLLLLLSLTGALGNAFIRIFVEQTGILETEFLSCRVYQYSSFNCMTECLRSSLNQVSGLVINNSYLLKIDRAVSKDTYGDFSPFLHSIGDHFTEMEAYCDAIRSGYLSDDLEQIIRYEDYGIVNIAINEVNKLMQHVTNEELEAFDLPHPVKSPPRVKRVKLQENEDMKQED